MWGSYYKTKQVKNKTLRSGELQSGRKRSREGGDAWDDRGKGGGRRGGGGGGKVEVRVERGRAGRGGGALGREKGEGAVLLWGCRRSCADMAFTWGRGRGGTLKILIVTLLGILLLGHCYVFLQQINHSFWSNKEFEREKLAHHYPGDPRQAHAQQLPLWQLNII